MLHALKNFESIRGSGADLGFSGGGADFQTIFDNFVDLFFRSTELIFRALPKQVLSLFLPKILRRRRTFEKQSKKAFLGALFGKF